MKNPDRYSYLVLAALALLSGEPIHDRIDLPTVAGGRDRPLTFVLVLTLATQKSRAHRVAVPLAPR